MCFDRFRHLFLFSHGVGGSRGLMRWILRIAAGHERFWQQKATRRRSTLVFAGRWSMWCRFFRNLRLTVNLRCHKMSNSLHGWLSRYTKCGNKAQASPAFSFFPPFAILCTCPSAVQDPHAVVLWLKLLQLVSPPVLLPSLEADAPSNPALLIEKPYELPFQC